MSDNLYRLVYVSSNEIQGDDDTVNEEIKKILVAARESNTKLEVTGALIFNTGCFAQILEGAQERVEEVFERIQCDPRHSNVVILDFSRADTRGFDNWSMAYMGDSKAALEAFAGIAEATEFNPEKLSGDKIYGILQQHLAEVETLTKARHAA